MAETKELSRCNGEDRDLVARGFGPEPRVAYILSLGVVEEKRRSGIGSLLLQRLQQHLSQDSGCKALFLHVLSSNRDAIQFYEAQHFSRHHFLPLYYFIDGAYRDGISYVRYMNGGRAPLSFKALCRLLLSACSSWPSALLRRLAGLAHGLRRSLFVLLRCRCRCRGPFILKRISHAFERRPASLLKHEQVARA